MESNELKPEVCNCLALRQAARVVTQLYDQHLAANGLRTTQYSILARLNRLGPMTINALAAELVMDRTTLGRNILPLMRDGLVRVTQKPPTLAAATSSSPPRARKGCASGARGAGSRRSRTSMRLSAARMLRNCARC